MNDICKKLYSNSNYGAVARSENIEDIESKMDLSVWDYHDYIDRGVKYGDSIAYKGSYVPKRYLEDVKTGGVSSKQDELIAYETEEDAYIMKPEGLMAIQGLWNKYGNQGNMQDKYLEADTRNENEKNTMYNKLFASGNIILATRLVYVNSGYVYTAFKIGSTDGNTVKATVTIFQSHNALPTDNLSKFPFRPIVKLSYKHIDLAAGYDETNGWELK